MRFLVILFVSLFELFIQPVFAQSTPPAAALLPVSSMGIEPAQTQFIFNQLQERLSGEYALEPAPIPEVTTSNL